MTSEVRTFAIRCIFSGRRLCCPHFVVAVVRFPLALPRGQLCISAADTALSNLTRLNQITSLLLIKLLIGSLAAGDVTDVGKQRKAFFIQSPPRRLLREIGIADGH